jgi:hypothetical protein
MYAGWVMQAEETANFVMRLMTKDELGNFLAGTDSERRALAEAAMDRYCSILKSTFAEPEWPTAARRACLAMVIQKSVIVGNQLAA